MKEHFYYGSLHNHTDFSNFRLRDSTNKIETLIDTAISLGHSAVAITDHETISNAVKAEKYYNKIKKENPDFKLIRGNEIYLVRDGLNGSNFNQEYDKYYHFILLAKDAIGHQQIREISTRAWMRAYVHKRMMRVPTYYQDLFDVIGANPGHVIGSTACLGGALPTQIMRLRDSGNDSLEAKIEFWCQQLNELFGQGNFFFEMQPSKDLDQIYVNNELLKLSNKLNIPYIITNDAHYLRKDKAKIHEAFLNAQDGDREVKSFYATTYLMNDDEIHQFMDSNIGYDNVIKAYENIKSIVDMCEDYTLIKPLKIPCLQWRQFNKDIDKKLWISRMPMLEKFFNSSYREDIEMAYATIEGIENKPDLQNPEAWAELDLCLSDVWVSSEVNKARWSAYFINLQKTLDYCWEAGTLVGPGRGSGVGFLLLYALDIIQINALREKTKTFRFRFLNPDRVSVLDIDTDISGKKRGLVLSYLRKQYGYDRVANVLTLGTEKSKSAILTAARGLGIDVDIARFLSSMISEDRGQTRTLKQTFYGDEENGILPNKEFRYQMENVYPELWEVAQEIEGLICRVGIHAGGVIFVDEPFTNSTALMKAPSGEIITQFDLHDCEDVS